MLKEVAEELTEKFLMNKNKLRNRASAKLFKLADAVNIRNKASKKMFKKAKGLKKGGKV